MPQYYIYLISSLPMLHFGAKAPFSFGSFLKICKGLVTDDGLAILKTSSLSGAYPSHTAQPTLKGWRDFDIALRNELVRIRAGRRHIDGTRYLRRDGYNDLSVTSIAVSASRTPFLIEAERTLDKARWGVLDEMSLGHYFDIDALIIYAHKLLILEKWDRIEAADRPKALEEALGTVERGSHGA